MLYERTRGKTEKCYIVAAIQFFFSFFSIPPDPKKMKGTSLLFSYSKMLILRVVLCEVFYHIDKPRWLIFYQDVVFNCYLLESSNFINLGGSLKHDYCHAKPSLSWLPKLVAFHFFSLHINQPGPSSLSMATTNSKLPT